MEFNSSLYQFLQDNLHLSPQEMAVAVRHQNHPNDSIPMLLWQYGLISLTELQQIFDWLDNWIEL